MPDNSQNSPLGLRCHGPRVDTGYIRNGYPVVVLENEFLRIVVNAGRGAMIPEFLYKPADLDVLFKNPSGLRHHAGFTPTDSSEPLMDHHPGGWYECFPSGGASVKAKGGTLGFHGEIWGLPFEIIDAREDDAEASVTLRAYTTRTPWMLTKRFSLKKSDPALYLEETAANLGREAMDAHWGQHPMLGAPFLDEHCRVEMPATGFFDTKDDPMVRLRWPKRDEVDLSKVRGPQANQNKMVFVTDFTEGKYRVVSPTWKLAFEMCWDAERFPYCWLYENAGVLGAPWWGRAYCLAVEPFTGLPKALEEGHGVITVGAGRSETVRFEARIVPA